MLFRRVGLFSITLSYFYVFTATLYAGPYLNSSHGNTTYGVSRPGMATSGYSRGNCAHCHEQHTSVLGSEPAPTGGGSEDFLIFDVSNTSQSVNFCYNCHGNGGTAYQSGGYVVNRSYSYRAGNWTASTVADIKAAFAQTTAHDLGDVVTFAVTPALSWNFSTASNACAVCHNPHVVQGDPANSPTAPKSVGSRGYLLTRPSQSPTTNLWGDGAGEKMSDYTASYQAPYRFSGAPTAYEPDGSTTLNGSNLTDFNTFCTDCHNATNTIYSTSLGRNLITIDWNNEKHGKGNADSWIDVLAPYTSGSTSLGYVLSCLDCHEPHGSSNIFLLRNEVNGTALSGAINTTPNLSILCSQCHSSNWDSMHHSSNDRPYRKAMCSTCHGGYPQDCGRCHFHGAITGSGGVNQTYYAPTNRRTF